MFVYVCSFFSKQQKVLAFFVISATIAYFLSSDVMAVNLMDGVSVIIVLVVVVVVAAAAVIVSVGVAFM